MRVTTTLQPRQIISFFSYCPERRGKLTAVKFAAPDSAALYVTDMRIANNRSSYIAGAGGICADWFSRYERAGVDLGCANQGEQVEVELQNRAELEQDITIEFVWEPLLRVVSP